MDVDKFELIWDVIHKAFLYFRDNWIAVAAFILSVISLSITWRKNITDRQYANDKELLEQLKQSWGFVERKAPDLAKKIKSINS